MKCTVHYFSNAVTSTEDSGSPQSPTHSRVPLDDELPVISDTSNSEGENVGSGSDLAKLLTLHHLVIDCSTWAHIDLTGIRTLRMVLLLVY